MSEAEDGRTDPTPDVGEARAPLPEAVRVKVVGITADALGRMPVDSLPASLRRVASFAPNRRAKLAGTQIAAVIAADDAFRDRVATQVRAAFPELVTALAAGDAPAAADPVDLAAVAYLVRPEGWQEVLSRADHDLTARPPRAEQVQEHAERLRRQLDAAHEELKSARQKHRERLDAVKAENADLRHKLAAARERLRSAEQAAQEAETALSEARAAGATAGAAAEAEARRLRARVEELEREAGASRRADRSTRDAETLRARLLLDTLLESAQGLRRELALPPVTGSPADQLDTAAEGTPAADRPRQRQPLDTVVALRQLLALPKAHLVVDGYNVTKTAWESIPLESQRIRLTGLLAPLAARTKAEVTVVFDAAERAERPVVRTPRGVRVLFSEPGKIADDLIRELVALEPAGRPVTVVTSDRAVAVDVAKMGHRVVSSRTLLELFAAG